MLGLQSNCYGLSASVPTNPYVEALIPSEMVFGGGAWRLLCLDEVIMVKAP